MNKLGINLWNWAPGLSDACCGLPTKAAEMGFTALELPMTQPAVSPTLRDEVRGSGLEVSLCAAMGAGRDLSSFDADVRAATMQYLTDCLQTGAALGAVVLAGPLYAGGGKRHTLGMVSCGSTDHATSALFGAQMNHFVEGAAQLEGKHGLRIFTL